MSVQCKGQVRLFAEKFESWFSSLEWPQKSTTEDSDLKVSFSYHLLRRQSPRSKLSGYITHANILNPYLRITT